MVFHSVGRYYGPCFLSPAGSDALLVGAEAFPVGSKTLPAVIEAFPVVSESHPGPAKVVYAPSAVLPALSEALAGSELEIRGCSGHISRIAMMYHYINYINSKFHV